MTQMNSPLLNSPTRRFVDSRPMRVGDVPVAPVQAGGLPSAPAPVSQAAMLAEGLMSTLGLVAQAASAAGRLTEQQRAIEERNRIRQLDELARQEAQQRQLERDRELAAERLAQEQELEAQRAERDLARSEASRRATSAMLESEAVGHLTQIYATMTGRDRIQQIIASYEDGESDYARALRAMQDETEGMPPEYQRVALRFVDNLASEISRARNQAAAAAADQLVNTVAGGLLDPTMTAERARALMDEAYGAEGISRRYQKNEFDMKVLDQALQAAATSDRPAVRKFEELAKLVPPSGMDTLNARRATLEQNKNRIISENTRAVDDAISAAMLRGDSPDSIRTLFNQQVSGFENDPFAPPARSLLPISESIEAYRSRFSRASDAALRENRQREAQSNARDVLLTAANNRQLGRFSGSMPVQVGDEEVSVNVNPIVQEIVNDQIERINATAQQMGPNGMWWAGDQIARFLSEQAVKSDHIVEQSNFAKGLLSQRGPITPENEQTLLRSAQLFSAMYRSNPKVTTDHFGNGEESTRFRVFLHAFESGRTIGQAVDIARGVNPGAAAFDRPPKEAVSQRDYDNNFRSLMERTGASQKQIDAMRRAYNFELNLLVSSGVSSNAARQARRNVEGQFRQVGGNAVHRAVLGDLDEESANAVVDAMREYYVSVHGAKAGVGRASELAADFDNWGLAGTFSLRKGTDPAENTPVLTMEDVRFLSGAMNEMRQMEALAQREADRLSSDLRGRGFSREEIEVRVRAMNVRLFNRITIPPGVSISQDAGSIWTWMKSRMSPVAGEQERFATERARMMSVNR